MRNIAAAAPFLWHKDSGELAEGLLRKQRALSNRTANGASCRFRHMSKHNENGAKTHAFHRKYLCMISNDFDNLRPEKYAINGKRKYF
uniref:Uncharacterized protein n=1 Tax=Eubacterium cellulosolvens (strain ATCC 43171 / JCM 9499 / 6) TaxID=633697 RepID=I5ATE3_EUBC6